MKFHVIIILILVVVFAYFYLKQKGPELNRGQMIDFLNVNLGPRDWVKLADDELKIVYAVAKQNTMSVKASQEMIAQADGIFKKYNITF